MITFTGIYFIMGLLFFYTAASFDAYHSIPNWIYYWWSKGLEVLFIYCLTFHTSIKYKAVFKPILVFSTIRFLWEIVSFFTGITISDNRAIAILFLALVTVLFWLFLKELIKWRR